MPPRVGFPAALTSLWMAATATGSAAAGRWSRPPSVQQADAAAMYQYHTKQQQVRRASLMIVDAGSPVMARPAAACTAEKA